MPSSPRSRDTDAPAPQLRTFPDLDALSTAAAEQLVAVMTRALSERDRFTLALAGGSTPRPLYRRLAGPLRTRIPWRRVHLFWGDERYVPRDDPASNYRMAREALLDDAPIPPENVHSMPTAPDDPAEAAAAYEATLRDVFPENATFDLILLGLGSDGHTASLFPDDEQATADGASLPWVRAVEAPPRYDVRTRLTLTLPAINRARHAFFLVAGAEKHDALDAVLHQRDPALPPTHVTPQGPCTWFVDEAARQGTED